MRSAILVWLLAFSAADGKEKSVTLDVKDGDVRAVLTSMQKQCGIKNLIIDRDVQGSATFYLKDVPCRQAFPLVLRTFGLASDPPINSVLQVRKR